MPPQLLDPAGNFDQLLAGGKIDKALDEVEAHAANTGIVHGAKLGIADPALHGCNAARHAAGMLQGVEHGPIVGAMAGGLDNHITCKTEVVAQCEQLLP